MEMNELVAIATRLDYVNSYSNEGKPFNLGEALRWEIPQMTKRSSAKHHFIMFYITYLLFTPTIRKLRNNSKLDGYHLRNKTAYYSYYQFQNNEFYQFNLQINSK